MNSKLTSVTRSAEVANVPWEKRRRESAPAFAAFALYRDLGPQRSIPKVARELSKSVPLLKGWSKKHEWVSRCDQYDRFIDQRQLEATGEAWRVAAHRHAEIVSRVTQALHARLVGDSRTTALNPDDLDWGDIRGLMRDSVTLERQVLGQPSDFAGRVMSVSLNEALGHVRLLVELARQHMSTEQFNAFITAYAAKTNAMIEQPEQQQLGA